MIESASKTCWKTCDIRHLSFEHSASCCMWPWQMNLNHGLLNVLSLSLSRIPDVASKYVSIVVQDAPTTKWLGDVQLERFTTRTPVVGSMGCPNCHVQPIQIKEPSVRLPMRYSEGLASAAKNISPKVYRLLTSK